VNENEARGLISQALAGIAPEVNLDDVKADERLRDALDLDSVDFLSLVDALHSLAGVSIPESDYPRVDTLEQLVRYLVTHTA
jgi:acyl carrier protein